MSARTPSVSAVIRLVNAPPAFRIESDRRRQPGSAPGPPAPCPPPVVPGPPPARSSSISKSSEQLPSIAPRWPHSESLGPWCLNVYIRERHNCASCPWMDVPHRASSAMFKEAVLISALVRRSRLGYPQESHIAMIAEYA